MEYTWYIHGYTMYIHGSGYTWYILGYTVYIYTVYPWYIIWWIYMVYTWYIHGYSWIFLDFWNQISRQARAAGLIQWTHVCGWSRVFYSTRHHGNCAMVAYMGNRLPTKDSTRLLQTSPLCRWRRRWRRRRRRCRGSLSVFLVLSRATTWILVKDGANLKGAFRASAQCVKQLRCLPGLKTEKELNFYLQRQ